MGIESDLDHIRPRFDEAFQEGFAAGKQELAKLQADDPFYAPAKEPQLIEITISRDQITNGAGALYLNQFKSAGRRAALDGRRGDRGAYLVFDDSPGWVGRSRVRFVAAYR